MSCNKGRKLDVISNASEASVVEASVDEEQEVRIPSQQDDDDNQRLTEPESQDHPGLETCIREFWAMPSQPYITPSPPNSPIAAKSISHPPVLTASHQEPTSATVSRIMMAQQVATTSARDSIPCTSPIRNYHSPSIPLVQTPSSIRRIEGAQPTNPSSSDAGLRADTTEHPRSQSSSPSSTPLSSPPSPLPSMTRHEARAHAYEAAVRLVDAILFQRSAMEELERYLDMASGHSNTGSGRGPRNHRDQRS